MRQIFKEPGKARMVIVALLILLAVAPLDACIGVAQKPVQPVATPWPSVPVLGTGSPVVAATPTSGPSLPFASQGVYESCTIANGALCLRHLQQISQAGFTIVLNYDQFYGTADEQIAYAQQASELGMKIIWNMDYPVLRDQGDILRAFPELSETCGCSNTAGFVSYFVGLVKNLPATWGYYIGDEVPVSEQARLQAFSAYVKELDPSHPRLIVQESNGSASGVSANLAPFASAADVLAADFYPVGSYGSTSQTGVIARAVQTIATQNGKQSAMVLQAFSWSEYRGQACSPSPACTTFPTLVEMRQMIDLTLGNSDPALILWYSYSDIQRSDDPSQHLADLIQAAKG